MARLTSVSELQATLAARGDQVALLDVRETAESNLAHIAGSCSLPRRQIEWRLSGLVPWPGTPVVVCDDDGRRASLAAATIEAMGYRDVAVLTGGLNRWVTEGFPTEWGVNVPSKDFGEKVLLEQGVPEIEPDALAAWLRREQAPLILDSRTPEEHQRWCIPGSRSLPGGELGLRIWDLIGDLETPVVVHCAGRTRSIIGAGTLRRLGLRNVFALKNGTMGWQLAGLELETGSDRLDLPPASPEGRRRAEAAAREVAAAEGVQIIGVDDCRSLSAAATENVYLLDVRSREEYARGHVPGFRWAPGGQLVQATDNYLAVRGGKIVLACDGIARAALTGAWLRQMGHPQVYALDGGSEAWQASGLALERGANEAQPFGLAAALGRVARVDAATLAEQMERKQPLVVFVDTSEEFSAGHVPGSRWLSRSWLEPRIGELASSKREEIVVTCGDGVSSTLAANTLLDLGYERVSALAGGLAAWRADGRPVERGLSSVVEPPNDVLPVRRSYAEMLNYLRWEEALGEKYHSQAER